MVHVGPETEAPIGASTVGLIANFATNRFSLRLSNFRLADESPVTGELVQGNGRISGNALDSTITGTLGTQVIDHAVTGSVEGFFAGPAADKVGLVTRLTSDQGFAAVGPGCGQRCGAG